jgi:hypothetical protein
MHLLMNPYISPRTLMHGLSREALRLAQEYFRTGDARFLSMFANHCAGMLQRSRELTLLRKDAHQ